MPRWRRSSARWARRRASTTSSPCCATSRRCGRELPRIGAALRPAQEADSPRPGSGARFRAVGAGELRRRRAIRAAARRALLRAARAAGPDAAALHRVRARAAALPRRRDAGALPRHLPPPAARAVLSRVGRGAADRHHDRPAQRSLRRLARRAASASTAPVARRARCPRRRGCSRPGCSAAAAAMPKAWSSCCGSTSSVPVRVEQHVGPVARARARRPQPPRLLAQPPGAARCGRAAARRVGDAAAASVATASTSSASRSARSRSPAITTSCPAAPAWLAAARVGAQLRRPRPALGCAS